MGCGGGGGREIWGGLGGGGGRGMLILFASLPLKRSSFRVILKVVGLF